MRVTLTARSTAKDSSDANNQTYSHLYLIAMNGDTKIEAPPPYSVAINCPTENPVAPTITLPSHSAPGPQTMDNCKYIY